VDGDPAEFGRIGVAGAFCPGGTERDRDGCAIRMAFWQGPGNDSPATPNRGKGGIERRKAGPVTIRWPANRKGSACCTLRAQNPSLSPRGGPPWGQAVNRDRGRMRNRISRRRTAVHGLTGCPRSLAGLAELRSKPTGGSSRSAAAAAATSITDPPGHPSLAGRRAGAVRRVVGRGRGDAPQLHQTAAAADSRRPIRTGHRCAQTRAGR
jgi:hypothetical protein